jgi:hypothetical protein
LTDGEKPDVFLCHAGADKPWVRELGARLEAESIDGSETGRRIHVFFDEWDIETGENIVRRLGQELASGAFVAVAMSPEFFASDWTALEWTDVVARDPANKSSRLIPLRLRDVSLDGDQRLVLPSPFNALKYLDFRSTAQFERVFQELLRRIRDQPLPRGRLAAPRYSSGVSPRAAATCIEVADQIPEVLISNFAPLISTPPALYVADAKIASLTELPADRSMDGFVLNLRESKLFTFGDLEDPDCQLNAFIDPYSIKRHDFTVCVREEELRNSWLSLANKCLARALRKKRVAPDDKGRFYFLPGPEQRDRQVKIGQSKPRDVAAKKRHHVSGEDFWVHYSADIRFRIVAEKPFLRILPSYAFTRDGIEPLDHKRAGRFRVIWSAKQDSAAVLRQILFWLQFLADGREEWVLETGGTAIHLSTMPATADMSVGVANDHIHIKALLENSSADELAIVADSAEIAAAADETDDESDLRQLDNGEEGAANV